MDKLPTLKAFLAHGEAEHYRNVTVEYITGHHPVLFIEKTRQRLPSQVYLHSEDAVSLLPYAKSRTQLHELMRNFGFQYMQDDNERHNATMRARQRNHDYAAAGRQRRLLRKLYFDDEQYYVKRFQNEICASTQQGRFYLDFQRNHCPYGSGRPPLDFVFDNYRRIHAQLFTARTGDDPPPPLQTSMQYKLRNKIHPTETTSSSNSSMSVNTTTTTTLEEVVVPLSSSSSSFSQQQQEEDAYYDVTTTTTSSTILVGRGAQRRLQRRLYHDDERFYCFGFQEHVMNILDTLDDNCFDVDQHPLDFVFDTYRKIHHALYQSLFGQPSVLMDVVSAGIS